MYCIGTLTLEGTASINLLEHGDLGIATLTGSDGEVILLMVKLIMQMNIKSL